MLVVSSGQAVIEALALWKDWARGILLKRGYDVTHFDVVALLRIVACTQNSPNEEEVGFSLDISALLELPLKYCI